MDAADATLMMVWRNALAVVPLALIVGIVCLCFKCRPSTRHALWLVVLASLLMPPLLPGMPRADELVKKAPGMWTSVSAAAGDAWSSMKSFASTAASDVATLFNTRCSNQSCSSPCDADDRAALACDKTSAEKAMVVSPSPTDFVVTHTPAGNERRLTMRPATISPSASPDQPNSHFEPELSWVNEAMTWDQLSSPHTTSPRVSVTVAPHANLTTTGVNPAPQRTEPAKPDESLARSSIDGSTTKTAAPVASPVPAQQQHQKSQAPFEKWLNSLAAVQDAIVRVPPIPVSIWLSGVIVILFVALLRTWRFRRLLATSTPAPAEVKSMVNAVARRMGLRDVPAAVMIDKPLSPMIWCAGRMTLVIPTPLWEELDDAGRAAVITHELAHLKRRDHWVCWLSAIVGAIYWWHPLVWWTRRRLREEADFCCDTWVTDLLPRARRAYAQALLATRTYISDSGCAPPVLGMGAMTPRAKRFARRLTMVMTNKTGPRMSRWGFACVAVLGMGAWLAAPLWACPPESTAAGSGGTVKAKVKAPKAPKAPMAAIAPSQPSPPTLMRTPSPSNASTFERHMAERSAPRAGGSGGGGGSMDQRLDQLERRLNQLTERLEQMFNQQGGGSQQPRQPAQRRAPSGQSMNTPGGGADVFFGGISGEGPTIERVYQLPDGKLEALYGLMARSDVPTLVRQVEGGISVQATESQHHAFGAFVQLIHPEGHAAAAIGAELRAVDEARAAQRGAAARSLLGTSLAQERALADQYRALGRQHADRSGAAKAQAEALRHQSRRVQEQAENVRKRAEELREKAEKMREKAQSKSGNEQDHINQQADALAMQADQTEAQADEIEAQADQIESQADEAEILADAAADESDEMREVMEELMEEMAAEESEEADAAPEAPPAPSSPSVSIPTPATPPAAPNAAPLPTPAPTPAAPDLPAVAGAR